MLFYIDLRPLLDLYRTLRADEPRRTALSRWSLGFNVLVLRSNQHDGF
jgi:hypothetical protein